MLEGKAATGTKVHNGVLAFALEQTKQEKNKLINKIIK